jgi:hypothetical protein
MKRTLLLSIIIACLTGCTASFWEDAVSNHKSDYDQMFADGIKDDINAELKHEKPPWGNPAYGTTWREYWIVECEGVYNAPEMGDAYVQYIIDQRSRAGLPDILEIDKRQFRSPWQVFTNHVDIDLNRELHGFPPPAISDGKIWVKTWPDYWKVTKETISPTGIEYINDRRKQLGLQK